MASREDGGPALIVDRDGAASGLAHALEIIADKAKRNQLMLGMDELGEILDRLIKRAKRAGLWDTLIADIIEQLEHQGLVLAVPVDLEDARDRQTQELTRVIRSELRRYVQRSAGRQNVELVISPDVLATLQLQIRTGQTSTGMSYRVDDSLPAGTIIPTQRTD